MQDNNNALIVFEKLLYTISTGSNEFNKYIIKNVEELYHFTAQERDFLLTTIEDCLDEINGWRLFPQRNRVLIFILKKMQFREQTLRMLVSEMEYCETFSEKMDSFWKLSIQLFYWNEGSSETITNGAFKYLVNIALDQLPKAIQHQKSEDSIDILIVVQQFIFGNHSPSLEVADYAKTLISLGRKVEILITNEMIGRQDKFWDYQTNGNDELIGRHVINIDGHNIPITGIKQDQSLENIFSTIKSLVSTCPKLVISVGCHCIYSELLGYYTKLITIPTSLGFYYSINSDIILWFSGDRSRLGSIRRQYDLFLPIIITDLEYQYIAPKTVNLLSRDELKVEPHDKIGVIVGNRLEADIDDEFIKFLTLLIDTKFISIIIVGELSAEKKQRLSEIGGESISFIKFQPNLVDLFGAVDFFLNPKRLGGGTTAAHALSAGLLVFSLRFGDVSNISLVEHTFDDYDQMLNIINILKDDCLVNSYRDKCKLRFSEISDRKYFIQRLLKIARV